MVQLIHKVGYTSQNKIDKYEKDSKYACHNTTFSK